MPKQKSEYPEYKALRVSKKQFEKWDRDTPEKIRDFLDGKYHYLLQFMYELLNDKQKFKLLKDFTPKEKKILRKIEEVLYIE